jgi:hypothetical protein
MFSWQLKCKWQRSVPAHLQCWMMNQRKTPAKICYDLHERNMHSKMEGHMDVCIRKLRIWTAAHTVNLARILWFSCYFSKCVASYTSRSIVILIHLWWFFKGKVYKINPHTHQKNWNTMLRCVFKKSTPGTVHSVISNMQKRVTHAYDQSWW